MSTVSRVEEPRAWLAETEPEPGVTWSLREAWVPPFSRPISRSDTAKPRTAGPFNVRLTCSLGPLPWSEDRRREADPLFSPATKNTDNVQFPWKHTPPPERDHWPEDTR